jgi:dihydroorotase
MNISTGKLMIKDDAALKDIFSASRLITVHAEGDMVDKAIQLSKACGNKLYLCHISTREELDMIRDNRSSEIYAEATPHHLFLNEQDDLDSFTKMKPELKSPLDQEALFEAAVEGLIDTIGTDHAPHTIGEKMSPDFPHGIPGCETALPLLLNAVNDERISLQRVIELCCERPARIFRIMNKGFIREGYDADLVVVDMDLAKEVDEEKLYTKCKWSPFAGRMLKGWPVMTIVNGNVVFADGEVNVLHQGKEVEYDG